MRIIETKAYTFNELSEQAKSKAIERLYDIDTEFDWYQSVYDDAENIGLKITEFDLDSGRYVKADFIGSALDTANAIISDHGKDCETYKSAQVYLNDYKQLVIDQCQDEADYLSLINNNYFWQQVILMDKPGEIDTEEIDKDFLHMLCEDYRIILQHEYDYRTSEEAIIETIEANEYEFTENGELI